LSCATCARFFFLFFFCLVFPCATFPRCRRRLFHLEALWFSWARFLFPFLSSEVRVHRDLPGQAVFLFASQTAVVPSHRLFFFFTRRLAVRVASGRRVQPQPCLLSPPPRGYFPLFFFPFAKTSWRATGRPPTLRRLCSRTFPYTLHFTTQVFPPLIVILHSQEVGIGQFYVLMRGHYVFSFPSFPPPLLFSRKRRGTECTPSRQGILPLLQTCAEVSLFLIPLLELFFENFLSFGTIKPSPS